MWPNVSCLVDATQNNNHLTENEIEKTWRKIFFSLFLNCSVDVVWNGVIYANGSANEMLIGNFYITTFSVQYSVIYMKKKNKEQQSNGLASFIRDFYLKKKKRKKNWIGKTLKTRKKPYNNTVHLTKIK